MTEQEKYFDYLQMLRRPFQKLARLRFLQPDGSTAFMLDNRTDGEKTGALISEGQINHNWQNGQRTSATVTISNVDGEYDYNFNTVWFGQEIALDEGLILSDGQTEFYIQQGVFLIDTPTESVQPTARTVTYNLVDKVAALDGSLGGNLDGTYQVPVGTNIFTPIVSLLAEDKGNGYPVDRVTPVFTEYYNDKTQALPNGTTSSMTDAPYTLTIDGTDGTIWSVVSGLAAMVNGWVGYDQTGALRIDPSQDDILDTTKPVEWEFSMDEAELLGLTYSVKNTQVYNDYIVIGEQLSDYSQPKGRAQIYDPRSPVDINAIGRKTIRVSQAGFGTNTQCQDYAEWMVKRSAILQRAVTISCSQILHIQGNTLVTVARTDKVGNPVERHLVQGFSRPLAGNGAMTITATSVNDFPLVAHTALPQYQPVEWLKSTDGIDLGIYTTKQMSYESAFYIESSATQRIYASDDSGQYTSNTGARSTGYWRFGSSSARLSPSTQTLHTAKQSYEGVWLDGSQVATYSSMSDFTSSTTLKLLSDPSSTTPPLRLYSLKIYNNTTLMMDIIPVRRLADSVYGFYDKVNTAFYTNESATFTAGADSGDPI